MTPGIKDIPGKAEPAMIPCEAFGRRTERVHPVTAYLGVGLGKKKLKSPSSLCPEALEAWPILGPSPHQEPPKVTHSEVPVLRVEAFTEGAHNPPDWF